VIQNEFSHTILHKQNVFEAAKNNQQPIEKPKAEPQLVKKPSQPDEKRNVMPSYQAAV
jgi:hypothetical protein